jgi:SAM-dependent methyltransferase
MQQAANPQAAHYDGLLADYEKHYYAAESARYRESFIYTIFDGIDLNGLDVIELACGSGANSAYLQRRFPECRLTGLDISPLSCKAYEDRIRRPCIHADLTDRSFVSPGLFDAAIVIFGVHHCANNSRLALANISGLVKPGGWLLMVEPSARFFLESVRRVWYRLDSMFEHSNERAIDPDALLTLGADLFRLHDCTYFGGPANIFILNSMILRMPLKLKSMIAPGLMIAERAWNRLPWAWCHVGFRARWIRL